MFPASRSILTRCAAAVGAAAVVSPVALQTAGAQQTLPETVVTAYRTGAVPSSEVGSAVTVITGEELGQRQQPLVSDVLREVPGVAVSRAGTLGQVTQVRIRGAEGNHTLVLIDGIEANNPAADAEFNFAHLLTSDIERIEVLRGPQSAVWGSEAIGGVVNIVTRRGSGAAGGSVRAEAGSFGTTRFDANVGAGSERWHYSLGGARLDTDGESVSPVGDEKDGYENTTLSFRGGLMPSENVELELVTRYVDTAGEGDRQEFAPGSPAFGLVVDSAERDETQQLYGKAQATLWGLDGDWENRVSAQLTDIDSEFFDGSMRTSATEGQKTKLDFQSTLRRGSAGLSHTFTVLAETQDEDFSNRGATPADPSNQDRSIGNDAFVGEYRAGIRERTFLSAAVRHDDNERFEDETTYRLTAAHLLPASRTRVHASFGTGVKNPGFIDLFGFFPGSFVGNPDLAPEKSTGWDAGVEQELLEGRLVVDLTWFEADLEDEIVTRSMPDPATGAFVSTTVNLAGESQRRGIELSADWWLTQRLSAGASWTWTESEDPGGMPEIRRPEHVASLNVNYLFAGDRGEANLTVAYNGEQDDLRFLDGPPFQQIVTLDSYTLVNLAARYRVNDTVRVVGRVDNLTDEEYQEIFGFNSLGRAGYVGLEAVF